MGGWREGDQGSFKEQDFRLGGPVCICRGKRPLPSFWLSHAQECTPPLGTSFLHHVWIICVPDTIPGAGHTAVAEKRQELLPAWSHSQVKQVVSPGVVCDEVPGCGQSTAAGDLSAHGGERTAAACGAVGLALVNAETKQACGRPGWKEVSSREPMGSNCAGPGGG